MGRGKLRRGAMKSDYLSAIEKMQDADLRREYSNLFDEGSSYRSEILSRDVIVAKIVLVTQEMRKRGI
jgi:hypothetical protein